MKVFFVKRSVFKKYSYFVVSYGVLYSSITTSIFVPPVCEWPNGKTRSWRNKAETSLSFGSNSKFSAIRRIYED